MMFIFLILLIIPVFMLLRPLDSPVPSGSYDRCNALDILRERFARGEISTDQFKTMKNILS